MKITYYNDTKEAVEVRVIHYTESFSDKEEIHTVAPQGKLEAELDTPEGEEVSALIRRWEGGVLITYVRSDT